MSMKLRRRLGIFYDSESSVADCEASFMMHLVAIGSTEIDMYQVHARAVCNAI